MKLRLLIALLLAPLPSPVKIALGRLLLEWKVGPGARIGFSVVDARRVDLGANTIIGSLTMIKGLEELTLEDHAIIYAMNWISGPPLGKALEEVPGRHPALILRRDAAIVNRHLLDCTGTIELGPHAILAGARTSVMTHSVNGVTGKNAVGDVHLGEYAAVLHGCIVAAGCDIAARTIVSAGSVVTTPLVEELTFYRGNPAEAVRTLSPRLKAFHRPSRGDTPEA